MVGGFAAAKVITGNGQLTRGLFIIIDFLRNPHFSRNRISGELLISGRFSTKTATVLSAAFESTADFLVTFALRELYVCVKGTHRINRSCSPDPNNQFNF